MVLLSDDIFQGAAILLDRGEAPFIVLLFGGAAILLGRGEARLIILLIPRPSHFVGPWRGRFDGFAL